jgi:hypothetical protein
MVLLIKEYKGKEILWGSCYWCKNNTYSSACKAFPNGRPEEVDHDLIWGTEDGHMIPRPDLGQENDVVFIDNFDNTDMTGWE